MEVFFWLFLCECFKVGDIVGIKGVGCVLYYISKIVLRCRIYSVCYCLKGMIL